MSAAVSLVDADPDLCAGLAEEDLPLARRVLLRPRYEIPSGRWAPELLGAHEGGFGLLVLDGAIIRQLRLGGRDCTRILGPGDVLQEPRADVAIDCPVSWTALTPTAVVVLDERFTLAARRWPVIGINLQRRLLDQTDRVALHAATAQLPRVEQRMVALFWQLADRWGSVTPFGIEIRLPLTHDTLGRLVGAQRPTVTLALRELAHDGTLSRSARDSWLLCPDSREQLLDAGGSAPAAAVR